MIRLDFADAEEIMDFLIKTREFEGWETVIFRLSAENGLQLDIKTAINDTMGLAQYLEFNQLKSMLTNFMNQNKHLNINLEIKFKFPDNQRKIMDQYNSYNSFYINFYCDTQASFATTSFLETSRVLSTNPIVSWGVYVTGMYNSWRKSRGEY